MPRKKDFYKLDGKTLCLSEWSREVNIPYNVLRYRVKTMGLPLKKAIEMGVPKPIKTYLFKGEYHTVSYYANKFEIGENTLRYWLKRGCDISGALDRIRFKNIKPRSIPKGCKYPDCEHCVFSDCIAP